MVFCSCSFLAYYLLTAVVSYVAVYVLQVVLGKLHRVGEEMLSF